MATKNRAAFTAPPSPSASYDPRAEAQFRGTLLAELNRLTQFSPSDVLSYLNAQDYGVVGDGTTDDTIAMQAALDAGYEQNRVVNCGSMIVKLTATDIPTHTAGAFVVGRGYVIVTVGTTNFTLIGAAANTVGVSFIATGAGAGTGTAKQTALTMRGPGIVFDYVCHGDAYDGSDISTAEPGFLLTGTGYTALMVNGKVQYFRVGMYGTDNAVNGVVFKNIILSIVQHVRVYKLDGFGVRIDNSWDTLYGSISVEKCGTSSEYAFSMNDDADGNNTSVICRLQVETPDVLAIYIDGDVLSCEFGMIHSEGLTNPDSTKVAYYLGGASCIYHGARISTTNSSADCNVRLTGAHTTYTGFRIENSIDLELEAYSSSNITLITPVVVSGDVHELSGQSGTLTIVGGDQAAIRTNWTGNARYLHFIGPPKDGTWTPAITFGGGSTGITYLAQEGYYSLNNRQVYVWGRVKLSAKGSSTGSALITGCPYTPIHQLAHVNISYYGDLTGASARTFTCYFPTSTSSITLGWNTGDSSPSTITNTEFTNTTEFIFSANFEVEV